MTPEQYTTAQYWHEFDAWNTSSLYGYGTAAEADEYCDILNEGRTTGLYQANRLDDDHAKLVLRLDENTEAFNLDDELAARKGLR